MRNSKKNYWLVNIPDGTPKGTNIAMCPTIKDCEAFVHREGIKDFKFKPTQKVHGGKRK